MENYLVLDVGGTFIKYALMDADLTILEYGKAPTPLDSLDGFLSAVRSISEHFSGQFAGVAVSLPGSVDTANGVARTVGALAYISNTPLATLLQDCLGVPATIANVAYCAASAEAWNGALSDVNSGCVVVLGTGIGGGIVLDRKVWMGQSFSAGQFSALPADFDGIYQGVSAPDSPGLYSFWTGLVSASGLLHSYAVRKGLSPTGRGLDGVQFFAAYDAGEPETVETLQAFGKQAAAGIYAIQSVLDVQRFAIGGGISARPEVTAIIRESLERLFSLLPFTPFPCPEIVTCRYGNDANLIGALRFYLENKR